MRHLLEMGYIALAGSLSASPCRSNSSWRELATTRLVAHRGAHLHPQIPENTLEAFDRGLDAGLWGLELDVRWTADAVPVVIHDSDGRRVFGAPVRVEESTCKTLRRRLPLVPLLNEVIDRYGGRVHLMIEIKTPAQVPSIQAVGALVEALSGLKPVVDYHLLALDLEMYSHFSQLPHACFLPVATTRVLAYSRRALAMGYAGVAGHYLFCTRSLIHAHHLARQKVGTGFIATPGGLLREVARGVDWIFTNRAVELQSHLRQKAAA